MMTVAAIARTSTITQNKSILYKAPLRSNSCSAAQSDGAVTTSVADLVESPIVQEDTNSLAAAPAAVPGAINFEVPEAVLAYIHLSRFHKPIGLWLAAWPGLWAIAMATPPGQLPEIRVLLIWTTIVLALRGAGCTVNDMWDKDIDSQVERTSYRPLASGRVSMAEAAVWAVAQTIAGIYAFASSNNLTVLFGMLLLPMVAAYPTMKRLTPVPQAFLGLTMSWGVFICWPATTGECNWECMLTLYAASVLWTIAYDTIYAHMDKKDDATVGIYSSALTFGPHTKPLLYGFTAAMAVALAWAGQVSEAGMLYDVGVTAGVAHVTWQIADVDLESPKDCLEKFQSNTIMGALPFAGIVLDHLIP